MRARLSTGHAVVDAVATMSITGNVTPTAWQYTVTRPNGRADTAAIAVLADIVYWYRPRNVYDDATGRLQSVEKKFASDMLQRSYDQLAEHLNMTKGQVKAAVVRLEELGVVRRVFRTVRNGGMPVSNVMYLDLDPEALWRVTFPDTPVPIYRHPYSEISTEGCRNNNTGVSENPQRGVAESADVYRDYLETTTESKPRSGSGSGTMAERSAEAGEPDVDHAEFELAWSAAPVKKRSPKVRAAAVERWAAARERLSVDDATISRWYRQYVGERRQAGIEERYIAALSTWLAPKKPIEGPYSLDALAAARGEREREHERLRAEAEASARQREEYERERRTESEWLESDPRARELHDRAFAMKPGPSWIERTGDALREYFALNLPHFR